MTSAHRHVLTDRLDLRRTDSVGDLDDLFAIFSDPDGWWFDPVTGRRVVGRRRGPVIAWVAPQNTPSIKVAERLGLTNHGLHADPSDGQSRLAYAERSLESGAWDARAAVQRAPGTR